MSGHLGEFKFQKRVWLVDGTHLKAELFMLCSMEHDMSKRIQAKKYPSSPLGFYSFNNFDNSFTWYQLNSQNWTLFHTSTEYLINLVLISVNIWSHQIESKHCMPKMGYEIQTVNVWFCFSISYNDKVDKFF